MVQSKGGIEFGDTKGVETIDYEFEMSTKGVGFLKYFDSAWLFGRTYYNIVNLD